MARRRQIVRVPVAEIRHLSKLQVTLGEAAAHFGLSVAEFRERIDQDRDAKRAWEQGREIGKTSIRRAQYRLVERGNAAVINQMAKTVLGQVEPPIKVEYTDGDAVQNLNLEALSEEECRHFRALLEKMVAARTAADVP